MSCFDCRRCQLLLLFGHCGLARIFAAAATVLRYHRRYIQRRGSFSTQNLCGNSGTAAVELVIRFTADKIQEKFRDVSVLLTKFRGNVSMSTVGLLLDLPQTFVCRIVTRAESKTDAFYFIYCGNVTIILVSIVPYLPQPRFLDPFLTVVFKSYKITVR